MIEVTHSDNFNTLDIGNITINDFKKKVTGFNVTNALLLIQNISSEMRNSVQKKVIINNSGKYFLITTEGNSFITKYLILCSSDLFFKKYTLKDYADTIIYFNHLTTDLNFINPNDEDSYKTIIRMINSQFRQMRHPSHILSRYNIFFNELNTENASKINSMLEKALELNYKEIITISYSIIGLLIRDKIFNIEYLINHEIKDDKYIKILSKNNITKYLKLFEISIPDFRKECSRINEKEYLEKYSYNPIWRHPIIKTRCFVDKNKAYIIPSITDLAYASSEGVYYMLMEFYKEKKGNTFSDRFGVITGVKLQKNTGIKLQIPA